ncbi:MAG: rhomboid family intramembrane serine protease [bacterium]
MNKKSRIYYFSHLIIFVTGIFYLIDLSTGGRLALMLELIPGRFVEYSQWWRLFTFPLATGYAEGIILFILTFMVFAPKLEEIYHTLLYPIVIMSIIAIQGLVFTLILRNSNFILFGTEGITFFVLTLFSLLNMKIKLIVANRFYVPTPLFIFALSFIWLSTLFFHSVWAENYWIIFQGLFSSTFGSSLALIAYLHIRYTKIVNPKVHSEINKTKKGKEISDQILSLAMIANKELKKVNNELRQKLGETEYVNGSGEDILNEILDKISEKGEDSLTDSEKFFLEDYSNQI